jgi:hypothetical protein
MAMKTILTAAAALCLTACAVHPRSSYVVTEDFVNEGPGARTTAIDAGCASGYVAAGHPWYRFTKDTQRYISDPAYKSNWDDGFAVCKGKYEAIGRAMQR